MKQYIKIITDNDLVGTLEVYTEEFRASYKIDNYKVEGVPIEVLEKYPVEDAIELLYDLNDERLYEGKSLVRESWLEIN